MNISKVTSSSTVPNNKTTNSIVNALEKQKAEIVNQIEKVKGSKEDSKTKAEKIKQLNEQLAEIDKQIMQAKIDEKQKKLEEAQAKNAEKAELEKYSKENEESNGVIISASLNKVLLANKNFSEYKNLHSVRLKLKTEMNTAQSEIEHPHNGGSIKYQLGVVAKVGPKISNIEARMAEKGQEIHKNIEKSVKLGMQKAEKNQAKNILNGTEDDNKIDKDSEVLSKDVTVKGIQQDEIEIVETKNTKKHKTIDVMI